MTVSTTDSVIEYTGNGSTTTFPVPFKFLADGDLVVTSTTADGTTTSVFDKGSDYTVIGAGAPAGGAIIMTFAPASGVVLAISRELEAVQETDLRNQGRFYAETHESVFDRLTMLIQQCLSSLSRALIRPIGKAYYDARGRAISNLGDPVSDQDAVTKIWVQRNTPGGLPVGDYLHESQLWGQAVGGTDNRGVELTINKTKGALRVGGSDTAPLDDEMNFWAALGNKNAWGAAGNIGLYSVAFNRNGCSYGTYSATFGHDCITFGTASLAGGAGSCTGAPSTPSSPNFEGYCSLAFGKNVLADGQKSAALGDTARAAGRGSLSAGYQTLTAPGTAGGPAGVASEGIGTFAIGNQAQAYGDNSGALGYAVRGFDGTVTIGSGINPGNPLAPARGRGVGIGANSNLPSIWVEPGIGQSNKRGSIAFHGGEVAPRQKVEALMDADESWAFRSTAPGAKANIRLQGTTNGGASLDLFRLEWESTNGSSALGVLRVYVNGSATPAVSLDSNGLNTATGLSVAGNKVVGARQAAIASSDGSQAATGYAVNQILIALRAHGLIAT